MLWMGGSESPSAKQAKSAMEAYKAAESADALADTKKDRSAAVMCDTHELPFSESHRDFGGLHVRGVPGRRVPPWAGARSTSPGSGQVDVGPDSETSGPVLPICFRRTDRRKHAVPNSLL